MSQLPTYSFLPWLRHGVANTITSADGDASVKLRASIEVKMRLKGDPLSGAALDQEVKKEVKLFGPSDVVGIESKAIVKVEPRHWITNFEPNYLPYIEFYDEDFPWRYTPAAPGAHHRLRPWIMLVVLKQDEFEDGKNILNKPLPFIKVLKEKTLPAPDDHWAWAHVHVNRSLNGADPKQVKSENTDAVATALENLLKQNPDLACSRILCPRKLEENVTYHAFLVPSFESGRLAGLGLDFPPDLFATKPAWGTSDAAVELPVYHRWQFSTGTIGDFEYLVRLLKPAVAKPEVGRRDLDAHKPGANLPEWVEAPGLPDEEKTEGIFKLGGALRAPLSLAEFNKIKKYERWTDATAPNPHPFQETLAALLNLEDDYKAKASQLANQDSNLFEPPTDPDEPEDLDPVVTPPIYGRWHAKTPRLLTARDGSPLPHRDNWIHEMNLDPRFRVANGFGTGVVQKNQEDYMFAAWKQIGDVLKGNQVIKQGHLSLSTSLRWYTRHIEEMPKAQPQQFFFLTAPVHRRVISQGVTLAHAMKTSMVAPALVSPQMRRIIRPRGRLMKALPFSPAQPAGTILQLVNEGKIFTAPPKKAGDSTPTISKVTNPAALPKVPPVVDDLLKKYPLLKWIVAAIAILLAALAMVLIQPFLVGQIVALVLLAIGFWLFWLLMKWEKAEQLDNAGNLEDLTPETVEQMPKRPDFKITLPGDAYRPATGNAASSDSEEGSRFRATVSDWAILVQESKADAAMPPTTRLDFPALQAVILDKIHPVRTIPPRVLGNIQIPGWVVGQLVEFFEPVMAYPKLDFPMYKPLEELGSEMFLPNLHLIENNTISLLKTNQKFIESYMVGLNHEFARELLWREYPTDQRGSYFRQFWDVSTVLKPTKFPAPEKENEEKWRGTLYDIPEIHTWSRASKLGNHDNRELPGKPQEEEVVLVIRGELLKKYPTAVIYAHKAEWALHDDGTVDNTKIRKLIDLSPADEADLEDGQVAGSNQKLKTPLYHAKVAPDIYFFGFDLTVEEVQGAKGDEPDAKDRPGWFFVIKERPGEPRFGLDIDKSAVKNSWNDLSWEDVKVVNGALDVGGSAPAVTLTAPTQGNDDEETFDQRKAQFEEDSAMTWSANTNAAELAYILYQVPVLVAVHGAEMLPADLAPGDF
jgi:hypothetical protein